MMLCEGGRIELDDLQLPRKSLDTTWKVSSFAGRQSLCLSGWH
jgi:hypothetical protein